MNTVTVCLCTYNRREELERCLQSIAAQENISEVQEVLVIENGCTDGTAEWLQNVARKNFPIQLRVESEPKLGIAHARNRAWRECNSDIILWTDDDVTMRPGFVEAHMRAFEIEGTVLTGGRIIPRFPDGTSQSMLELFDQKYGGPAGGYDFGNKPRLIGFEDSQIEYPPIGANFGIARSSVEGKNPFKEYLGWGKRLVPGEETLLFLELMRSGAICRYVPEGVVDHHILRSRLNLEYYLQWRTGHGRSEFHTTEENKAWFVASAFERWIYLNLKLQLNKKASYANLIRGDIAMKKGRFLEAFHRR